MSGVNKIILIGNLGKDPEVKYLENKVAVARFPIATTETWKDRDGSKKEHTEWHNIVLWRGLAEISEKYLRKGDKAYIEGRIRSRVWEDKEGNKRYTTEVVADKMTMLSTRRDKDASGGPQSADEPKLEPADDKSDDLPF